MRITKLLIILFAFISSTALFADEVKDTSFVVDKKYKVFFPDIPNYSKLEVIDTLTGMKSTFYEYQMNSVIKGNAFKMRFMYENLKEYKKTPLTEAQKDSITKLIIHNFTENYDGKLIETKMRKVGKYQVKQLTFQTTSEAYYRVYVFLHKADIVRLGAFYRKDGKNDANLKKFFDSFKILY